jgi:hypothetical protein
LKRASQFAVFPTEIVAKAYSAATEIVSEVEPVYFNSSMIETNTIPHSSLNGEIHCCFFVIEWISVFSNFVSKLCNGDVTDELNESFDPETDFF